MKKITRKKIAIFLGKHKTDRLVLNIGAGSNNYKEYFPNLITLDIDAQKSPNIVADIHKMPFRDNEFALILCTEVLEHLKNPMQAIKEIQRVLKSGGKLILTTRFIFPLHVVPNDYFRYTKYGLKELFKEWDIIELEAEANSLETIAVLLQRLIFQVNYKNNKFTKGILLVFIKIFLFLSKFIEKEFGDIKKDRPEKDILSSGYYLVAINKK